MLSAFESKGGNYINNVLNQGLLLIFINSKSAYSKGFSNFVHILICTGAHDFVQSNKRG